jgi:hypothetical protein
VSEHAPDATPREERPERSEVRDDPRRPEDRP